MADLILDFSTADNAASVSISLKSGACFFFIKKSINYFLVVKNDYWEQEKLDFMSKLRNIPDVLLAFEIDIANLKYIDRFIFNDKEN